LLSRTLGPRPITGAFYIAALIATALLAQPARSQPAARGASKTAKVSFQAQAASTVTYSTQGDEETVEIKNIAFEVTSEGVPGRPVSERLLLRKTTRSKQVVGDIGEETATTLEAWPLGIDPKQKPLYSLTVDGPDGETVDGALFVVSRGVEDVDWWSVYKLGTGQHLFDTYVPLVKFSLSREIQELRYVGLEVPPDDATDARLREAHVAGVLTYASADKVIREALITCDDPKQAVTLRAYEDATRLISVAETPAPATAGKKAGEPGHAVRISINQNYPSAPETVNIVIPVAGNDLDLAHAQLPPRMHIAAWRR